MFYSTLVLLIVSILSGITLFGFFIYDYHCLRTSMADMGRMAQRIVDQQKTINQQQMQIHAFAEEIDTLEDKLVGLNRFEKKVRQLASLGPYEEGADHTGVGGATPESLDPKLGLKQDHDRLIKKIGRQIDRLEIDSSHVAGSLENLIGKLEKRNNFLAATPSIRPADGWISSPFGKRTSPFTGLRTFHSGLDIANQKGTPIVAPADGVVTFTGKKENMGNVVVIDHGHGIVTRYAHLSKALKKRGDKVKRGGLIAKMGNSGRSTGPHLHYEVRLNGVPVNPEKYILN